MSDDPVEVFPLAQFICEEMEERGWTSGDVALRMGGPRTIEELQKDQLIAELMMSVSDDNLIIRDSDFAALETAFGVSGGFFQRLHAEWLRYPDRRAKYEAPDALYGAARKTGLELVARPS